MTKERGPDQHKYRLVLSILSVIVILLIGMELLNSWNQPKAQSQLNLYQSDLLLQASVWQPDPEAVQPALTNPLLDANPVADALKNYRQVRDSVQTEIDRIQASTAITTSSSSTAAQRRYQQSRSEFRDALDLKLGLLLAESGQPATALSTWSRLTAAQTSQPQTIATAKVLIGLWSEPGQVLVEDAQALIRSQLQGWFRWQALERLDMLSQDLEDSTQLAQEEQAVAATALLRVSLINGLTIIGNILGMGILLFWLYQAVSRGIPAADAQAIPLDDPAQQPPGSADTLPAAVGNSVYAAETALGPSVLWPLEVVWQVMVLWFLAFFAVSLAIPLIIYGLGIQPDQLDARAQGYFALFNYLALMGVGLGLLIWSLKPFLVAPLRWFKLRWHGNWAIWGLSGYFAALPLVIVVALLNQKLLGNQGGGNPLLEVIVQSQDLVTAGLLFVMVAVLAPLFEELLFRGFFLTSLCRYLPTWGAVGLSGLVFAIAHLNLADILPLTVLGCVLGFVYGRSRNLLASMLLHSLWNSGSFLSLLILGSSAH